MVTKKRALVLIVGILLIITMACGSDSDSKPATVTGDDGVAAAYEPRSIDEVKPRNIDLKLGTASALPETPDIMTVIEPPGPIR